MIDPDSLMILPAVGRIWEAESATCDCTRDYENGQYPCPFYRTRNRDILSLLLQNFPAIDLPFHVKVIFLRHCGLLTSIAAIMSGFSSHQSFIPPVMYIQFSRNFPDSVSTPQWAFSVTSHTFPLTVPISNIILDIFHTGLIYCSDSACLNQGFSLPLQSCASCTGIMVLAAAM